MDSNPPSKVSIIPTTSKDIGSTSRKASPWYLLKDTTGEKSVSFTMAFGAFALCSLWFLISMFHIKIGTWEVREFDAGASIAFMTPVLANYFGRRLTEAKTGNKEE